MRFFMGRQLGAAWVEEDITDERGGRWIAAARLAAQGGHLVVSEVRLFPRDDRFALRPPGEWHSGLSWAPVIPAAGVTHKLLRRVPIGAFAPFATSYASRALESGEPAVPIFRLLLEASLPGVGRAWPPRPRPRRNIGHPDEFYAELAREYVAACQASRRPLRDIARRRSLEPERVRDLLHEARERGLLSPGTPGRRGGHLLPRAVALLTRPSTPVRRKARRALGRKR